jgi:hypothetical protein
MRVCLAFLTRDHIELSRQTIKPLIGCGADICWVDGSTTEEGKRFPHEVQMRAGERHGIIVHGNVRGGPDAAVAYALTQMLKGGDWTHVGLVENDVLLSPDWFGPTMALFERGAADGLAVGAVSARAYEDRILFQRDGYAVMHNLGWGTQILTREAAELSLAHMRTSLTSENRRLFARLSNLDIGRWWAFRSHDGLLCADWGNDRVLASHGFASLALVPSPVEMIGQEPLLAEQGLKVAGQPVELFRDDVVFATYAARTAAIRRGEQDAGWLGSVLHDPASGAFTYFAHQVEGIGARYEGDWRLEFSQGFGPFAWRADPGTRDYDPEGCAWHNGTPKVTISLSGFVELLASGGKQGGSLRVEDTHSGYVVSPTLPPRNLVSLPIPAQVSYRDVRLTALSPGVVFYGVRSREPQPFSPQWRFDWHKLPPV